MTTGIAVLILTIIAAYFAYSQAASSTKPRVVAEIRDDLVFLPEQLVTIVITLRK